MTTNKYLQNGTLSCSGVSKIISRMCIELKGSNGGVHETRNRDCDVYNLAPTTKTGTPPPTQYSECSGKEKTTSSNVTRYARPASRPHDQRAK